MSARYRNTGALPRSAMSCRIGSGASSPRAFSGAGTLVAVGQHHAPTDLGDAASRRGRLARAPSFSPCSWWATAGSIARHRRRPAVGAFAAPRVGAQLASGSSPSNSSAISARLRRTVACGTTGAAVGWRSPHRQTTCRPPRARRDAAVVDAPPQWRPAAPRRAGRRPGPTSHCATMAPRFLYSSASCGETLAIGLRKTERRHATHVEDGQGPLARRGRVGRHAPRPAPRALPTSAAATRTALLPPASASSRPRSRSWNTRP